MHIPDGFLSTPVWLAMWIITLLILALAFKKTNQRIGEKQVPLMGVLAAFIFAGQMLNTPVAGGTSGHMLGGVLAAVFLGPYTASIVMASVFIVQALLFQDGGVTTLGANIFNMGFIGAIAGYYLYLVIKKIVGDKNIVLSAGVAAWLSLVLASAICAVQLGLSGAIPLAIALTAMVSIHAVIGLIEAALTMAAIAYVQKTRPDLLELEKV